MRNYHWGTGASAEKVDKLGEVEERGLGMAWRGQQTPSLRCEALRPDGPGAVSGGKDLTEERTVAEVR